MSLMARKFGADDHALLALVLDGTHDCVKILDADGRIEFVNRRGAEAMELRSPEELIGRQWIDRWPIEEQPKIQEALDRARSGEQARFQAMRPRPDASAGWWDVIVAAVRSADGAFTHFLTIARDITPEITERERAQAISAEMRHRLRNVLSIAAALVNMSARRKPEVQEFAAEIMQRFGQLSNVQEHILDLGVRKKFGEIASMLAAAYGDGTQLEFGVIPEVEFDDSTLQALALSFGELCTNSLKYGALANDAKIKVNAEVEGDLCTLVWLEQTEFKGQRDGGQGLKLIDRIVTSTGGRVVRSINGRDLTVRISLPLSKRSRPASG